MSKERSKRIVLEAWEGTRSCGGVDRLPALMRLSVRLFGPYEAEKLLNHLAFDAALSFMEGPGGNDKTLEEIKRDLLFHDYRPSDAELEQMADPDGYGPSDAEFEEMKNGWPLG